MGRRKGKSNKAKVKPPSTEKLEDAIAEAESQEEDVLEGGTEPTEVAPLHVQICEGVSSFPVVADALKDGRCTILQEKSGPANSPDDEEEKKSAFENTTDIPKQSDEVKENSTKYVPVFGKKRPLLDKKEEDMNRCNTDEVKKPKLDVALETGMQLDNKSISTTTDYERVVSSDLEMADHNNERTKSTSGESSVAVDMQTTEDNDRGFPGVLNSATSGNSRNSLPEKSVKESDPLTITNTEEEATLGVPEETHKNQDGASMEEAPRHEVARNQVCKGSTENIVKDVPDCQETFNLNSDIEEMEVMQNPRSPTEPEDPLPSIETSTDHTSNTLSATANADQSAGIVKISTEEIDDRKCNIDEAMVLLEVDLPKATTVTTAPKAAESEEQKKDIKPDNIRIPSTENSSSKGSFLALGKCVDELSAFADWSDSQLGQLDEDFGEAASAAPKNFPLMINRQQPSKSASRPLKLANKSTIADGSSLLKTVLSEVESLNQLLLQTRKKVAQLKLAASSSGSNRTSTKQ